MGLRITTWNGKSPRLESTDADFDSEWYQVSLRSPTRFGLFPSLFCTQTIVNVFRNPFGYQPWRGSRTFEVSQPCS